jgi:hypothetical protein
MNRRRTTTWSGSASAAEIASETLAPVPASPESNTQVAFSFVPRSGWTSVAPPASAASMSSTGSSGS